MKFTRNTKTASIQLTKKEWIALGKLPIDNDVWLDIGKKAQFYNEKVGQFALPAAPTADFEFPMQIETEMGEKVVNIQASGEVYPAEKSVGYNRPHVGYWNITATDENGNAIQLSDFDERRAEELAERQYSN